MDVKGFASELLRALATVEAIERVALQSEGPVVKGRAYVTAEMFLEFYFNEKTGTMAFALIRDQGRVWGIDRDNIRGWHLHPLENPMEHVGIEKLSVSEIVGRLRVVLLVLSPSINSGQALSK
jgi:hypothetical protein